MIRAAVFVFTRNAKNDLRLRVRVVLIYSITALGHNVAVNFARLVTNIRTNCYDINNINYNNFIYILFNEVTSGKTAAAEPFMDCEFAVGTTAHPDCVRDRRKCARS